MIELNDGLLVFCLKTASCSGVSVLQPLSLFQSADLQNAWIYHQSIYHSGANELKIWAIYKCLSLC